MIKYFSLTVVLLFTSLNKSISQNNIGNIAFSLVMPEEIDGFDQNQLSRLESKIIQATTNVGIAGKGYYSDFILYPIITINDVESHSQSMKNTTSVSIDLGIFIKSVEDGRIFSSYSKTLMGIGTNKINAISNAISDLDPKSKDLIEFYTKSAEKIINYFESKCDDFISKADSYSKMGKYDEAIALLMSIPNISPICFEKVKLKSIAVYKLYSNKTCNSLLLSAKGQYANGDVNSAIKTLLLIDPTSDCFVETKNYLLKIEKEVKENEKEALQTELKLFQNEYELEKIKIAAIKDIAIAYYAKNPNNYNYYEVILPK